MNCLSQWPKYSMTFLMTEKLLKKYNVHDRKKIESKEFQRLPNVPGFKLTSAMRTKSVLPSHNHTGKRGC